ncbi:MAG TPA: ATPase, T2SS/T4P/T4SS family [Candidatus Saccharimonadales bacterium]|nr:ATPase, T2SS/T4P/T4SS family [Candidatus Saccharimonadales bacterium]
MTVLSTSNQKQVEDALVEQNFIKKEKLEELKQKAETSSTPLLSLLVSEGHVSAEVLTKLFAHINHLPYVNLSNAYVEPEILQLLPQEIAEQYMAVPLGEMQHRLVVAMLDADNVQASDFLSNKIGRPIKVYSASEEGIKHILKEYRSILDKDVSSALDSGGLDTEGVEDIENITKRKDTPSEIKNIVEDSPVSKTLTSIMEYAAKNGASDIHIEPFDKLLKVRCRIDGILREIMRLPKSTEPAIVSRIKILSNLKIDEHRVPQDGQFTIIVEKREIDLRIAISPVVWGEQVVIRLLDKTGTSLKLEDMGYTGRSLRTIREGLKQSYGMVLTSGPTGSGKSTSMYAMIQEIKSDEINIVTLEDPVEYKITGVNQIQVNPDVGLTFATGLRSILRQDPNVIMVGEIRDQETATLAVQAALTGHLVFSTLHTNSAAGILPRLLDMGIEPFLIASTVHTVIGQRLVRKLDSNKVSYQSNRVETEAIHQTVGRLLPNTKEEAAKKASDLGYSSLPLSNQSAYTLWKGTDSSSHPGGYKGRVGLYEAFEVTEPIQDLIIKRATSNEIQKVAKTQGTVVIREDGYLKAMAGLTTTNEVDRVATTDIG